MRNTLVHEEQWHLHLTIIFLFAKIWVTNYFDWDINHCELSLICQIIFLQKVPTQKVTLLYYKTLQALSFYNIINDNRKLYVFSRQSNKSLWTATWELEFKPLYKRFQNWFQIFLLQVDHPSGRRSRSNFFLGFRFLENVYLPPKCKFANQILQLLSKEAKKWNCFATTKFLKK